MGRQHGLTGLITGVGLTACDPTAPPLVKILLVGVTGGAALLPDLDEPNSTAARSLGPITRLLARAITAGSLALYYATRLPADPPERESGHRLFTHVPACCLLTGALFGLLTLVSPVSSAVTMGLLWGLLGVLFRRILRRLLRWVADGFWKPLHDVIDLLAISPGLTLAALGGLLSWHAWTVYAGWWWLFAIGITAGMWIHREGDWPTNSGVPLRRWPIPRNGRRWELHTLDLFPAGGPEETRLVFPVLLVTLFTAVSWQTGLLGAVITAWEART